MISKKKIPLIAVLTIAIAIPLGWQAYEAWRIEQIKQNSIELDLPDISDMGKYDNKYRLFRLALIEHGWTPYKNPEYSNSSDLDYANCWMGGLGCAVSWKKDDVEIKVWTQQNLDYTQSVEVINKSDADDYYFIKSNGEITPLPLKALK